MDAATLHAAENDQPPFEFIERLSGALEPPAADWVFLSAQHLLSSSIDEAIGAILEMLGRDAGADRAWMIEYSPDMTTFHNSHEWCRHGVVPFVEGLQNTPVTMIAWLHEAMMAGKAVMIADVERMPRQARVLQAEMQRQGDRSVLSVPIAREGRLYAFFGLDAVVRPMRWSQEQVQALFRCGNLIAHARYGNAALRAVAQSSPVASPARVYLRSGAHLRGVILNDILGLYAERDYSRIHVSGGAVITDGRPLKYWEGVLSRTQFARIHRSAIINVRRIVQLERRPSGRWQVWIEGVPEPWKVSRTAIPDLRSRLGF